MKYILFLFALIILILTSSCSTISIKTKEGVIDFEQLPELMKEDLKLNLNVTNEYNGPLILNLESQNVDFKHSQKMRGSFAGDHYFYVNKKKFVLNLNSGYHPFVLYHKKIYCLYKPMGSPSIKKLEKSKFIIYDLKKHLKY